MNSNKLTPKWEGPYQVIRVTRPGAVRLETEDGIPVSNSWNIDILDPGKPLPGGSASRALRVKLAKMLNVPGVTHRNGIFGLQADCTGPGDSYYPIRAFPLRRQLVGIIGRDRKSTRLNSSH